MSYLRVDPDGARASRMSLAENPHAVRVTCNAGMRCLIVVPSLRRAGAETQAVDLANGLARLGNSVHLCSFEPQLDQRERLAGTVIFHHILRKWKYDWSVVSGLAEVIDRERIDVIQGVLQFATLVAWLASRSSKRKPPVVAAVHTTMNRGLKEEIQDRLLYRRLLRQLPSIIFVCQNQRDHWVRKYPELGPLARVVHNGLDVSRFRREEFIEAAARTRIDLGIPDGVPVFSCIAGFRPEKGHDLLVRAFAEADSAGYLILAGDGELRPAVEAAVKDAGLAARVRFLGNVDDVRPLIVASTATVLASTAVETFSIAMLESMALGVPVIAPRIGGLPEAVKPGQTGLLFDIGDVDQLARCIECLSNDPDNAAAMGESARILVSDAFTAEAMVVKNASVLSAVTGGQVEGTR